MALTLKTIWSVARSRVVINRTKLILFTVTPALLPLDAMVFMQWIPVPLAKYFFFTKGWVAWTLTEYCLHRWGYHKMHKRSCAHQHRQATNDRINFAVRGLSIFPMGAGLWTLWAAPVWFTYFSGWMCGLSLCWAMHHLVHHPAGLRFFPGLIRLHIWHHCNNPDMCFGISTTLWDRIFKTAPAKGTATATAWIHQYYAEHNLSEKEYHSIYRKLNPKQSLVM